MCEILDGTVGCERRAPVSDGIGTAAEQELLIGLAAQSGVERRNASVDLGVQLHRFFPLSRGARGIRLRPELGCRRIE